MSTKKDTPISVSATFESKKMHKIFTLDPRIFKRCEVKEVEVWRWRKMKKVKWLVHLRYKGRWSVKITD